MWYLSHNIDKNKLFDANNKLKMCKICIRSLLDIQRTANETVIDNTSIN